MIRLDKEDELFLQRLDELKQRCLDRYSPEFTHFLDGRQLSMALQHMEKFNDDVIAVAFGGFKDAERRVVGVFPKDVYGYQEDDINSFYDLFDIKAVEINGSGFSTFSHRDCLGSILGLGIKREALGDIYVSDSGKCAYGVLESIAADYVCGELEFVSRDKVKVGIVDFNNVPCFEKKFSVISGTVASFRLDCVVSLAINISREKAKHMIISGLIKVNHFEQMRTDYEICENDLLSIKGYGRFKVAESGGITRKGRNRIVIHKMI